MRSAISAPARRREPRWQKADRPSILDTVLPERTAGTTQEVYGDFSRPDPLSSDHIMDATARLLAPRKLTQPKRETENRRKEEPSGQSRSRRRRKKSGGQEAPAQAAQKVREAQPPKAAPAPGGKKRRDRGHGPRGGRSPVLPQKSGAVKDSTEQPSLMKPYYIEHD